MRILIVPNEYLPSLSGVPIAVRNLGAQLLRLGHEVVIVTSKHSGELQATERIDGIGVYRFAWSPRPLISLPWRFSSTLKNLVNIIHSFNPDLVYVHFLTTNALYVLIAHYFLSFPLVVSARGYDIEGLPHEKPLHRRMLVNLFRRADAIGFCSMALRMQAQPFLDEVGRQGIILGDGVDVEEIERALVFKAEHPYILAVGRLVPKKGLDLLIQAFANLAHRCPDVQLLIAGDGPERVSLETLVHNLGVGDRVRLLGNKGRQDVASLLKGCIFFVLPSRQEAFGIVNLEAMVAKKAVIATNVGGVRAIVQDGITGLLVEPSVSGLTNAMKQLLDNPQRCVDMGQRGYRLVCQTFAWEKVINQYVAVFEHVLNRKRQE